MRLRWLLAVAIAFDATPHADPPRAGVVPARPIRFEANAGQWSSDVRFAARTAEGRIVIEDDGVRLGPLKISVDGGRIAPPVSEGLLPGASNYFVGADPSRWHAGVPAYARVHTHDVLPGIDLVWHGERDLEYDVVVSAGTDPRKLELVVTGADEVDVTPDGSLVASARDFELVQRVPSVIQGGRSLTARFVQTGATRFTFAIDGYDVMLPSVIDPIFGYSSYLGGTSSDQFYALAIDSSGNVYGAGSTDSTDYPTQAALQTSNAGTSDVVVTKMNPSGSALVYSTYLGGAQNDGASGIALDSSGNVYLVGTTNSTDFPTASAAQSSNGGQHDAFVSVLNPSGSALVYSTYLGGSSDEYGNAIAVDSTGSAHIAGQTSSTNLPISNAFQATNAGGTTDGFVARLTSAGALTFSGYLGGSNVDIAYGVGVDSGGNTYVVGGTASTDFPTVSAYQSTNNGGLGSSTCFVSKVSSVGTSLAYSTYLGGSGGDAATGVAVDGKGRVYVTGYTGSADFPTASPAQASIAGARNAFVTVLNATGSALDYSTYFGGKGNDFGMAIAYDASSGGFAIAGYTYSLDFPVLDAPQATHAGGSDAFAARFASTGAPTWSTYLGGTLTDEGTAAAFDATGHVHVAGFTDSSDFPSVNAYQPALAGGFDAFLTTVTTPDLPNGTACTTRGECASYNCVDGRCCDTPCAGSCVACDIPQQEGTCGYVTGHPYGGRAACGGSGLCAGRCNGKSADCAYPDSTFACGSTCKDTLTEVDSVCDGDGGCFTEPPRACTSHFVCSNGACATQCATDADCTTGLICVGGACEPPPKCLNAHVLEGSDGGLTDCLPFICSDAATCVTHCTSTSDCVVGWVCDSQQCALPPYASSGCSCDLGRSAAPRFPYALLALLCVVRLRASARTRSGSSCRPA